MTTSDDSFATSIPDACPHLHAEHVMMRHCYDMSFGDWNKCYCLIDAGCPLFRKHFDALLKGQSFA